MPMLHCMCNITCLDDMFNNNGCFTISIDPLSIHFMNDGDEAPIAVGENADECMATGQALVQAGYLTAEQLAQRHQTFGPLANSSDSIIHVLYFTNTYDTYNTYFKCLIRIDCIF